MEIRYRRDTKYLGKLLLAFLMACLFFALVFGVAYSVSYMNYGQIREQNNLAKAYLARMTELTSDNICSVQMLDESSAMLDEVGSRIGLLEERFGKTDLRVLEQKKIYSDLEIKHFEIVKFLNEECDSNILTILFFYSNIGEGAKESENMGFVLSSFKRSIRSKVMVYSFDFDLNYASVELLKQKYGVKSAPIVLVGEQDLVYASRIELLEGYKTKYNLE